MILTSEVGKILEKIVRDKVVKILEDSSIITNAQDGFRSRRSDLNNLLDLFHSIYENWINYIPGNVIYVDFQKALKKVLHERLFIKLHSTDMGPNLTTWISDWLIGR